MVFTCQPSTNDASASLSPEEKKVQLFLNQKKTLDLFLDRHAISQEQYNKSLHDMTVKMGISQSISDNGR